MSKELNKTYDPKDIEDRRYKKWEDNGYFLSLIHIQMCIRDRMMDELSKQLDFEFRRNGSLILCFSEDDMPRLKAVSYTHLDVYKRQL